MLYKPMSGMPEERLLPPIATSAAMPTEVPLFAKTFGIVSI